TCTSMYPYLLVVHPSLPVKSIKELINLAKAKPGVLNYATTGIGGSNYLAIELFKTMAGINMAQINYGGTPPAINDLISGQVQLMVANLVPTLPLVKAGRLRALA